MTDQNTQFMAILTAVGEAKQANAITLGIPWKITQMGVGDANGTDPTPERGQTSLINERRRASLNELKIDPDNEAIIVAEQVIPENVGGWWIREIGLYDEAGDLVAVANCPPTFKPELSQGSGRTQLVRLHLLVSSTQNIVLKVDPSVVLATRAYVDSLTVRASQEDAELGEDNSKIATILRVFQAMRSVAANATEGLRGTLRLATAEQAQELTAGDVAITPETLGVVVHPKLTGSYVANGSVDNTIQMSGIVDALSLELGDVIQITGSTGGLNDKLFTVESITDGNSIIVNYEHAGNRGNGSLKLADETATVTITRIAKWYNAPSGLGQAWVDVTDFRSAPVDNWGATYLNTTGRTIEVSLVSVQSGSNVQAGCFIRVDGWPMAGGVGSQIGAFSGDNYGVIATVPFNSPYQFQIQTADTGFYVRELR